VPGEVTNAELQRSLDLLRSDLHDDLGEIKQQLARLVPREVYDAHRAAFEQRLATQDQHIAALEQRIAAVDKAADDHTETHRSTHRYVISAIVVPVVAILVQILLSAKGVHL
jgi:hypothetical protein